MTQPSPETIERVLLTMDDVAKRLRKSRRWLQDFLRDHPHYRLAGRTKLFTETDLLPTPQRRKG